MSAVTTKNILPMVLVGLLSSAIWSIAGEPFIAWFSESFIAFAHSMYASYYDLLHQNIGMGFREESGSFVRDLLLVLFSMLIIATPFITYRLINKLKRLKDKYNSKKEIKTNTDLEEKAFYQKLKTDLKFIKIILVLCIFNTLIGIPVIISKMVIADYNNNAIVFIERSIEILSPSISHKKILELRASYRAVSDANSFYHLYDILHLNAEKNSITLPKFEIARES